MTDLNKDPNKGELGQTSRGKTFKREVATLLLTFLCFVIFQGDVEMVKVIVYPFMAFAGLAFGLDWKTKQG